MRRKSVQKYKISCVPLQRKSGKCMRIDIFNTRNSYLLSPLITFDIFVAPKVCMRVLHTCFVASVRCLFFAPCYASLARACCLSMSLLRKDGSKKPMSSVLAPILSWQIYFANHAVCKWVASCCALRVFCKAWKKFFLRFPFFLPAPAEKHFCWAHGKKCACAYASSMKRTSHCPTSFVP